MSRVLFTFLLVAIAVPLATLRAEVPGKPELTKSGSGTLTLMGVNTYSGGTIISGGTIQLGNDDWRSTTFSGTLNGGAALNLDPLSLQPHFLTVGGNASPFPATPISAGCIAEACQPGPVFYIITEGAGLGDNVRCFPCTGKETVLDAVSRVNGISQVSTSAKIWIARPSPASHDKSTILAVNWEAIAKRGINTTNYTLAPGDRLVFGQDPLVTQSNFIAKQTAIIERLNGVVALTNATLRGLDDAPAADVEVLKDLVRKGVFTNDEEIKRVLQEMLHATELNRKNAQSKEAEKGKPGQ